jgi:hypothetical protein
MSAAVGAEAAARSRYGSSAGPGSETAAELGAGFGLRGSRARQRTERLPVLFGVEEHLEHHAPAIRMPRSVADPVGQRRLDEG